MLFDLHLHSRYSLDALTKPETIIRICKKNGWGVSITDHCSMDSYEGAGGAAKTAKKKGVFLIPGEEILVFEDGKIKGEVIAYFLNSPIESKSFAEIVDDVKSQGALLSCPHPFDWPRRNFKEFPKHWKKFACMETFNARAYYNHLNKKSEEFAEGKKIAQLGVSDAHIPEEIGNGLTEMNAGTENEFRKELKKQRTKVIVNDFATVWHHFQTQLARRKIVSPR
ncbi:MAG: PHP domain-containing protein [Candidatus Diapherotrites archaeon]|nr:PHP domain-containing protein [Candidatus Diapherotrites archaeon]